MKTWIYIVFCCSLTQLCAQSAQAELQKIGAAYKALKVYELQVHYKLYPTHTSTVLEESYISTICRKNEDIVTVISGVIQARLGNIFIQVDSADRKLFYAQQFKGNTGLSFNLDSVLKYYDATTLNDAGIEYGKITMMPKTSYKSSELSKIELFFYKKNHQVFKAISYYAVSMFEDKDGQSEPPPRLEAHYGVYHKIDQKHLKYFTESFYVTKKNNKLLPSAAFKGFELIDGRLR